jgi:hypothetical protein
MDSFKDIQVYHGTIYLQRGIVLAMPQASSEFLSYPFVPGLLEVCVKDFLARGKDFENVAFAATAVLYA